MLENAYSLIVVIQQCYNEFIIPQSTCASCGCLTCLTSDTVCMNDCGADVYFNSCKDTSTGLPSASDVYRVTYGYCVGGYNSSTADIAQVTAAWYWNFACPDGCSEYTTVFWQNPPPTYGGSAPLNSYNIKNAYITVNSPYSITTSCICCNCKGGCAQPNSMPQPAVPSDCTSSS